MMRTRKNPRLEGYDYSQGGTCFVTLCTADKQCLFGTVRTAAGGILTKTRQNGRNTMTADKLETPRLLLRPFRESDGADVYEYAKDPAVGPIAGWRPHGSEAESREIIRTVFSAPGVFAVELKETGRVVGSVGFVGGHPAGKIPGCPDDEIGYALGRAYWGRGLVPEAVNAVLEYGFTELGLSRIWCGHYAANRRSAKVIGKCGFRYQFAKPTDVDLLGEIRQTYFYMQTKEDWRERVSGAL